MRYGADTEGALTFSAGTGGTEEFMRIDNDGNVGIGTASPNVELDVLGYISSFSTATDATAKYGYYLGRPYTNTEENIAGMIIGSDAVDNNYLRLGGGSGAFNAVSNIAFYTGATSTTLAGTEKMRIDSSGNVGIGTTSPNSKLTVNGMSNLSGQVNITGDLFINGINVTSMNVTIVGESFDFTNSINISTNQSDGFPTATFGSNAPYGIYNNGSDFWILDTNMNLGETTTNIMNEVTKLKQENEELKKALCEIKPELELCK